MPSPTVLSAGDIAEIKRKIASGEPRTRVAAQHKIGVTKLWKICGAGAGATHSAGAAYVNAADESPWEPAAAPVDEERSEDLGLESAGRSDAPLRVTKHFVCVPPPVGGERPGAELFGKRPPLSRVKQLLATRAAGGDDDQEQAALLDAISDAEKERKIAPVQARGLRAAATEQRHDEDERSSSDEPTSGAGSCTLVFE